MTRKSLYNKILNTLIIFESGEKEKAKKTMVSFFENPELNKLDQGLYDLAMEFYIFICDGDLRTEGRDFGYKNLDEIKKELFRLK